MGPRELSGTVIAVSAIVIVLLERLFPYKKGQKIFRKGFFNDFFFYTILQSYAIGFLIFSFLDYVREHAGFNNFGIIGGLSVPLQVLLFASIHDFYIYWFHRWQHKNSFLWRIHEAHHSTEDVDWLSGSKSHALEILINQTVEFAPMVLLGAAPETILYKGVLSAVWGMFIHSNINVRMGMLQFIFNGPEMHRWHHSDEDGGEYMSNYSTKLAVWDYLFGTAFFPNPNERKPLKYGLKDTPDFPSNYFIQFLFAFRKRK